MPGRLGILGGTFDPVHLGHLASARDTAAACGLDRVLLVLSARPPHKPAAAPAPIPHRLAMPSLATKGDPLLEASDIEAQRPGPSYTVDTLNDLATAHPNEDLSLIVGLDAYHDIDTWHRAGDLLTLADIIVTSRPDSDASLGHSVLPPIAARNACCYDSAIGCYVHSSGHSLRYHQLTRALAVSASAVRDLRARRMDISGLVGAEVADYIEREKLYLATS
jgi:nicotinate-nucleotide adenylyltransferase